MTTIPELSAAHNAEAIDALERHISDLEAEALRLRAAALILRGDIPIGTAPTRATGTASLIIETLRDRGPMSNRDLTAALKMRGWTSSAEEPSATVGKALGRLVKQGRITRLDWGLFAVPLQVQLTTSAPSVATE